MTGIVVRPLRDADVPAAQTMSYTSLRDAGKSYGWQMPPLDDTARERGQLRLRHVLAHDAGGAFVADRDGDIAGLGLATRRGPLWFLSLLTVTADHQGQGVGRRLLEATMATFAGTGSICASNDPKALRRYRHAGFALLPCYEATGELDRSRLPAVTGVRPGSYDDDRDLVEDVATGRRGAPHGPDLDFYAAARRTLLVTDSPAGRGYVVTSETGPLVLGATTPDAAGRLLWTALAETTEQQVQVGWLSGDQQWALDVALAAGLALRLSGSRCLAGAVGPMTPYLPSGALG